MTRKEPIAVFDRDFKYIYVSGRYLTDYKVKEQNVIGKNHYEVFPDIPEKWREVHQRSLKGEVLSAEEDPYYREDGSIDWTCWECRPWYEYDGSIGGIIIYNEVINERKQANEELRKSEEKFRSTFHTSPDAININSIEDGLYIDINESFTKIMGYSREDAIGKSSVELNIWNDLKDRERLGYQVISRIGSLEALQAFRDSPDKFDLVITDMAMPNMSGDKLSAELTKIRSDIPVLICSGFSEIMSEKKAAASGIKGFLLKPIIMKDLAQKIREVLDKK